MTEPPNAAVLEAQVQELTGRLAELQRELDALGYAVSHDLRAPLRAIEGFSQILADDYGDKLDDEGRHHLTRIRAGTQRLASMIEDLLQLSRIGRAPLESAAVDLAALADDVVGALARQTPGRPIAVDVTRPLAARGDAALLRAVLLELLGNAWKFTGRRTAPTISVGEQHQDGQTIYFVRDNGAGFDMTYAQKLFAPFQRLHGPAEFAGNGIGLAKAARIVARHGGRLWADAAVDQGATFFFTLGG